jgi:hypothetical protein
MVITPKVLGCCLLLFLLGCEVGPRSGRGLRLPDGDVERGAVAFRDLGCTKCHDVADAPAPASDEIVLTLGGEVTRVETYGELVTSIVNPQHDVSRRYPKEDTTKGGVSRMENFNDAMTVAQLIDLTAFLQSKYEVRREPMFIP